MLFVIFLIFCVFVVYGIKIIFYVVEEFDLNFFIGYVGNEVV